jgi:hypothetical protein
VRDASWLGVECGISFTNFFVVSPTGKTHFIMTTKNTKTGFAAFEAKEIKVAQQLQVKGGDGGTQGIIGTEDVIAMKTTP